MLWVTSTDDSGEWAYARLLNAPNGLPIAEQTAQHAWVPCGVLQRAVYPICSAFDAQGQAQRLSLSLGDFVVVYHREPSGWTYGARLNRHAGRDGAPPLSDDVGWFPEACIAHPLAVQG